MIGRILTIGGATVECPRMHLGEMALDVLPRQVTDAFFAKLHKIPSQIDVLTGTCH